MKTEAPHSQASAEKQMTRIEEIKLENAKQGRAVHIRADIDWLLERNAELLEALKAIVFKARKRGWLVAQEADCRDLVLTAEKAIAKAEKQP